MSSKSQKHTHTHSQASARTHAANCHAHSFASAARGVAHVASGAASVAVATGCWAAKAAVAGVGIAADAMGAAAGAAGHADAADFASRCNAFYRDYGKRALSVGISVAGLTVCALPMAAIAVAVKLDDPEGPAILRQQRLGLHGEEFTMYKFRTMCVGAETQGSGVYSNDSDDRVTRVGRVLRRTSLDELPQLANMLRGDMALIGPRPPLTYHPWPLSDYTPQQLHMFDVRPGLTGWAQINGRRTVEWPRRIEYNLWYVDNLSLRLDAHIFAASFAKVIGGSDNENTGATAPAANAANLEDSCK